MRNGPARLTRSPRAGQSRERSSRKALRSTTPRSYAKVAAPLEPAERDTSLSHSLPATQLTDDCLAPTADAGPQPATDFCQLLDRHCDLDADVDANETPSTGRREPTGRTCNVPWRGLALTPCRSSRQAVLGPTMVSTRRAHRSWRCAAVATGVQVPTKSKAASFARQTRRPTGRTGTDR